MGRVEGKVALVTGGASGLGRATATLLAAEGARVVLSDLQDEMGEEVAAAINEAGGRARYRHQDTSDEAAWEALIEDILATERGLDILVNNAGISGTPNWVDEMPLDDWRQVIGIDLDAVFLGVKHGIRAMKQGGGSGSIINISSVAGMIGLPRAAHYCAAKGGVRLLTKAAALECAEQGLAIRVNSIHPGFIRTPMVERALQRPNAHRTEEFILRYQPTGQMGDPNDIAEGVVHLASDGTAFMTGSELVIDGGLSAR